MSTDQSSEPTQGIFTKERVSSLLLVVLTTLALYVCYRIVQPFVPALAFSIALAVATDRPYRWLRRQVRSDTISAVIAVLCVTLLILVPLTILTSSIVQAAIQNIQELRAGGGITRLRDALEAKPVIGPWIRAAEQRFNLEEQVMSIGQGVATGAGGVVAGSFVALTQIVITLFVLFFLYRDADSARKAFLKFLPLPAGEAEHMANRIAETIRATVNGSVTVALCQASLAATIYGILGIPMFVLWGAATFFAAFVPVFGTSLIWIPVSLYLLLSGAWVKALILVGWSGLVIGSIDNILYPFLVGDKLKVHTLLTFFAVLGGVGLFGPSGIILGPLTLAITVGLLDVWSRRMSERIPAR
jgi:predicted PurR-regulated permease PerM